MTDEKLPKMTKQELIELTEMPCFCTKQEDGWAGFVCTKHLAMEELIRDHGWQP